MSAREVVSAAARLQEECEMVDLNEPVALETWIMLQIARAALEGDLRLLDTVITRVNTEIAARKARS